MNTPQYFIMMMIVGACAVLAVSIVLDNKKPPQCHTFQRTDSSHIRLNSCTGEAHVIVRGPNGFEWQRIID